MVEKKKNTSGRGMRDLQVRVKSAKGRKLSSTLFLGQELWILDVHLGVGAKSLLRG